MSFEGIKAATYLLLDEILGQPEDMHQLQERLRENLGALRATGQPLPQDLVELEAWLADSLEAHPAPPPELPPRLLGRGRKGR